MDRHGYNSGTIPTTATTADTIIIPTERITQKRGIVELIIITTVVTRFGLLPLCVSNSMFAREPR